MRPARLLAISDDASEVEVIITLPGVRYEYVTLSHRRGEVDTLDSDLQRDSIAEICVSVPSLPATFRDRRYNHAPAGLQDDEQHRERESAKRASIFRGAVLTIAASAAPPGANQVRQTSDSRPSFPGRAFTLFTPDGASSWSDILTPPLRAHLQRTGLLRFPIPAQDRYLAGRWARDMPAALLWRTNVGEYYPPREYCPSYMKYNNDLPPKDDLLQIDGDTAASWSWASKRLMVEYLGIDDSVATWKLRVPDPDSLSSSPVAWANSATVAGMVKDGGSLRVRGRLRKVVIVHYADRTTLFRAYALPSAARSDEVVSFASDNMHRCCHCRKVLLDDPLVQGEDVYCTTTLPHTKVDTLAITNGFDCTPPRRLLNIYTHQSEVRLRLVDPRKEDTLKWCALSYFWGERPTLTTTNSTLQSRLDGTKPIQLPQTHRDAVETTREKAHDIAQMPDVYGNAYITLSASSASNIAEGFLHTRNMPVEFSEFFPFSLRYHGRDFGDAEEKNLLFQPKIWPARDPVNLR
ncbi:hypothetical protein B0H66DRAFT_610052 [Apodospora peruviana]|uniref:Uncharacterized protein n=1 Tax=Apodospora peruviana TaxID=516989 RepID=A0AAE0MF01_9PEZI|nr:hypothetical protein B0H66DRAFT_610052 [Apodospora peruviana]